MIRICLRSVLLTVCAAGWAQATLLTTISWTSSTVFFGLPWNMVTEPDTPEWAKLPNAKQWLALQGALQFNDSTSILWVLRALQYFDGPNTSFWLDLYWQTPGLPNSPATVETPEMGSFFSLLAALILLSIQGHKRGSSFSIPPKPCARRPRLFPSGGLWNEGISSFTDRMPSLLFYQVCQSLGAGRARRTDRRRP